MIRRSELQRVRPIVRALRHNYRLLWGIHADLYDVHVSSISAIGVGWNKVERADHRAKAARQAALLASYGVR